jgi:DNA-directed RNA polymerase delta subunit
MLMSYVAVNHNLSLAETMKVFSKALKDFVTHSSTAGQQDWHIIQHRLGLNNQQEMTLEELGSAFSLTRERIRQRESQMLTHITNVMNGYAVPVPVTADQAAVFTRVGQVWREFMAYWNVIREDDLVNQLKHHAIPCPKAKIPAMAMFILGRLGATRKIFKSLTNPGLPHSYILPIWIFSANADIRQYDIIPRIHNVMTKTLIHPSSALQITSTINQKITEKSKRYSINFIEHCLGLCSSLEVLPNDLYQVKLRFLSRTHQAARLIQQAGAPMLVGDLVREINKAIVDPSDRIVNETNLTNQMIASKQFKSIGRSGYWALNNMDVVTDNILTLMQRAFNYYGTPLTVDEIYAYVQSQRQARLSSIKLYLSMESSTFVKLPSKQWALKSWNMLDLNVEVPKFIKKHLQQYANKSTTFNELRDAIATQYGITKISASGIINTQNCVEVFQSGRQKMVRYVTNGRGKKQMGGQRDTLELQIQAFMHQQLQAQHSRSMLLSELVDKVCAQFQCPKATVYSYINRADFITKHKLNTKTIMCQLVGPKLYDFPAIQRLTNTATRQNIERAIRSLTDEDVDLALILLSKQFETEIQELVTRALRAGYTNHRQLVSQPGRSPRLVDMIDYIVKNNLLDSEYTLTFLRSSRNYFIHDRIPDASKKRALMITAPYVAGLFVNTIVDISQIL